MMFLRRGLVLSFVALPWLLGTWLCPAAAQFLGPEIQVNSYTTSSQADPAVAADSSGNFVVVWDSGAQDGSSSGVFGQRFNAAGSPLGSEFRVNSYTTNDQIRPAVAADGAGNFVVAWESRYQDSSSFGVFGQRYDSAGSPVGSEFQVNTWTTSSQASPAVAADAAGSFVVVWNSYGQDGSHYGVFARRYDSVGSPVGSDFQVNSYTTDQQSAPAVAVDGSGNFVVAWGSINQDGSYYGIFGQRLDATGTPVGGEFQVNSYVTSGQYGPAVAADGAGNFTVAWQSDGQDGSFWGVFGQRFNSAGSPVGSEFLVNEYTTGGQLPAAVAADDSGNFVVTWGSYQDGSEYGVFGRRFNSSGSPMGGELRVNSYTTSNQSGLVVAGDGQGGFVVAWQSNTQDGSEWGVYGRRLANWIFIDGFELGDACGWSAAVGGGCP